MTRRVLVTGLILVAALLAAALPAHACSCFYGDPRDQFSQADAAIVGEYVSARPSEDPDDYEAIYTFNVEEEWKTDFGQTLDVYSAQNGAACGIEATPGQKVGLFLALVGDEWHSNLCQQTSPATMRDAASPLPEPDGEGPARLIVGGSFGNARVMSLDARGRTLAYGYGGDHDTYRLDACPGGDRFVEVWQESIDSRWVNTLVVRRVSDLEELQEVELPFGGEKQLGGLDCRNRDASSVLVFAASSYGPPKGTLYEIRGGRVKTAAGDIGARYADFGERHAYLSGAKQRVWKMRLDGSSSRTLLDTGERTASVASISPDERHLAIVLYGNYEQPRDTRVALVRLSDGHKERAKLSNGVSTSPLLWDGDRRFVAPTTGTGNAHVYNLDLDVVGRFQSVYTGAATVAGGKLWAAASGELYKVVLPDGELTKDRNLPSPVNYALISLPG